MLLKVRNLSIGFKKEGQSVKLVENISFDLKKGQTVALVGQSGSGKSITALAIMGLLPPNFWTKGQVFFGGVNLLQLAESDKRFYRGKKIAYTLQSSLSLNPALKIKRQIAERSLGISVKEASELLDQVKLDKEVLNLYPYQLSGGMKQRVLLAIALALKPQILIADEPTTGLDANIAEQIMELLDELKEKNQLSLLLITHDTEIVSKRADKVVVYENT